MPYMLLVKSPSSMAAERATLAASGWIPIDCHTAHALTDETDGWTPGGGGSSATPTVG